MAVDFLPDEIVLSILARLPTKPLLRFRCVSKYWSCILREPYFMKLRSRKIIIIPISETLHFVDDNVPTDNTRSIFKRCNPLENSHAKRTSCHIIGAFDGIVILAYIEVIILYNPFTGESKKLPSLPCSHYKYNGYGFGYGATPDDLKIVRFRQHYDICDVYDFKKNSWSSWSTTKYNSKFNKFTRPVGTFVNGFLYWIKYNKGVLTVLSVKDMVLSEIRLPDYMKYLGDLGTINGCLCSLKTITSSRFELWVMKEHCIESSWMNTHTFTLDLEDTLNSYYCHLSFLDNGRILMLNPLKQLIIYNISKGSYKTVDLLDSDYPFIEKMHCVEYVESLVSPSKVCFSRLEGRKRKRKKAIKSKSCKQNRGQYTRI